MCRLDAAPLQGVVVNMFKLCSKLFKADGVTRWGTLLCLSMLGSMAIAQSSTGNNEDAYFLNDSDAKKYVLIITGAAASDEIRERFW